MKIRFTLLTLLMVFFLSACGGGGSSKSAGGGGNGNTNVFRGDLISADLLATKHSTYLIPYSVKAYKVVYYTIDVNGNKVKASGVLAIPQKAQNKESPLLSYQHGTIFLDAQAPTNSKSTRDGIMQFAGVGYIISSADYLGYGESKGRIHPYVHAKTLASASLDMIRASKTFLMNNNVRLNNQLFLAGYSEGGYATMALQKSIHDDFSNEFTVTASAPGAGPFDLSETANTFANQQSNNKPAYMSFLLKAYDSIYSLNKISEMYQPQYVDTINTFFDGNHSARSINDRLAKKTEDLFKPEFLQSLRGSGDHVLKEKLALNNLYNWKPTAPTRLYHGANDEIVPYSNSRKALDTMRANGASHITMGDCPLNTHVDCALPYIFDTRGFFSRFVKDL